MKGKELVFMAPRSRHHHGQPVMDAILHIAQSQGIKHYIRNYYAEGSDAQGHVHSAHFFELTDEPEELKIILGNARAKALYEEVVRQRIRVFCLQRPVEYDMLGED